ncbi:MAG: hypothetical protein IAE82_10670 [Opitutaceae bacterium]|nr:hypothetical protein [Opitutaceae bacterium]
MIPLVAIALVSPVLAAAGGVAAETPQVSFQTAMLLVVVVVLAFLGKKLADLGRAVRDLEERLAARTPAGVSEPGANPVQPVAHAPGEPVDVDTETAVVISATVAALWGPTARIVSVGEPKGGVRLWALEGRRQIFASHKIR